LKYNLADNREAAKALALLIDLTRAGQLVELKKVSPTRSLNQNKYLHVLLGAWGAHFGYTLDEAKVIYKGLNHDLYHYNKNGHRFIRSSAVISKEDMTKSIDRFRNWSSEHGYPLPTATDQGWLRALENEAEQVNHYL
jgi:hypothetical protein